MLAALSDAVRALTARLQHLEAIPFNPYSPDAQFFDHFAGNGTLGARWTVALGGSGTATIPNTTPTVLRLASGATLGSSVVVDWAANFSLVGVNKAVEVRAHFKVTTAVDADDFAEVRLQSATPDIIKIGVIGPSSTAFFVCNSTAGGLATQTTTVTTVPIDTAMHEFRIQSMPDRVRFYIDDVLVAEHTTNFPTAPLQPKLVLLNGANGGTRVMDVDLIFVRENR